ncbi:cytochrome C oxidase subunit IV [Sulfobacillus acidophilus DSM 10332]|uniref:Cytochrome C oxidase subunit IV n=1 Tax=Sulfobacillus acidophilus (strain ATCC 700253 / DSM 10332 / NAL) TaxID=679936 RepID=G8TXK3_SULAD|nr:cytochrome C oxidase subunit IV [Sulfobacillus acidophilus DSM 10332]
MADMSHGTSALHGHPEELHEDSIELASLNPHFEAHAFPWKQVFGFLASLVLTAISFWLVMDHVLPVQSVIAVILALAVVQALLQLGVFMHMRESRGAAWQILVLGLGLLMAFGLVAASIWIMMFKSGVS